MRTVYNGVDRISTEVDPKVGKEEYIIEFTSGRFAMYWMGEFIDKFSDEIVKVNKCQASIEFDDSIYYFWSAYCLKSSGQDRLKPYATIYPEEAAWIILDDPERLRVRNCDPYKDIYAEVMS